MTSRRVRACVQAFLLSPSKSDGFSFKILPMSEKMTLSESGSESLTEVFIICMSVSKCLKNLVSGLLSVSAEPCSKGLKNKNDLADEEKMINDMKIKCPKTIFEKAGREIIFNPLHPALPKQNFTYASQGSKNHVGKIVKLERFQLERSIVTSKIPLEV